MGRYFSYGFRCSGKTQCHTGFPNASKLRFLASPHKRNKNKEGGSGGKGWGGPDHPHAKTTEQAYQTVVLESAELGAAGSRSKEEMLKETAKLISDWTNSTIGADVVRSIVG